MQLVSCKLNIRLITCIQKFNKVLTSENYLFLFSGADGSVRMFDLRHLEHSTIIYEDPTHVPLLRLAWNKQDPNYLATMAMDALEVKKK